MTSKMKFKPGSKQQYFDLCNGKWHSIHAVKDRRTLQLSVDGISAEAVTDSGPGKLSTVDTGDRPLHIGGIQGLSNNRNLNHLYENGSVRSNVLFDGRCDILIGRC